eukprot:13660356-Ditylum_brightwellii.AAC.1
MSPELLSRMEKCGYEEFYTTYHTSHRGFYINFETECLFGNKTQHLALLPTRELLAKNPFINIVNVSKVYKHLTNNNFWPMLQTLEAEDNLNEELAEKLDTLFLQACLHGKKCCRKRYKDWWCLPLAKACYKVQTLLSHLGCLKVGTPIA